MNKAIAPILIGVCLLSGLDCPEVDPPTPTVVEPPEPTLVVARVTDPETRIGMLAVERAGDEMGVLGNKDAEGNLHKVTATTYVGADGTAGTIWFGDNGLPLRAVFSSGWIFDFSNHTDDTVDVTTTNPNGDTTFHPTTPTAADVTSALRDLAESGIVGSDERAPAAQPRTNDEPVTLSHGLRAASLGWSWGGCIGNVSQIFWGLGSGIPGAVLGCTGSVLSTYSYFTGNELAAAAADTLTVAACAAFGTASCVSGLIGQSLSLGAEVAAHYEARGRHEATLGQLRGLVRDAATGSPLAGAQVLVIQGANTISGDTTHEDGQYEVVLPDGTDYLVDVSKTGYLPTTYYGAHVVALQTTQLETLLQVDEQYTGIGDFGGRITNALDGRPVANAVVQFRSGINARSGSVVASAATDAAGVYSVAGLPSGIYTGQLSTSGFVTSYFTAICLGGQSTADQDATITPQLSPGEIRIVLTWGASPSDLDSHLTGPASDGSRFHVFYRHPGSETSEPYAALDRDDTSSYGPETITIYQRRVGTYRYTVHDYSNRRSATSSAMAMSGAEIKVFGEAGLLATFSVPSVPGTAWTVFELQGDSGNVAPLNTMQFVTGPGDVRIPQGTRAPSDVLLLQNLPDKGPE